jgi:hypothetical protein
VRRQNIWRPKSTKIEREIWRGKAGKLTEKGKKEK